MAKTKKKQQKKDEVDYEQSLRGALISLESARAEAREAFDIAFGKLESKAAGRLDKIVRNTRDDATAITNALNEVLEESHVAAHDTLAEIAANREQIRQRLAEFLDAAAADRAAIERARIASESTVRELGAASESLESTGRELVANLAAQGEQALANVQAELTERISSVSAVVEERTAAFEHEAARLQSTAQETVREAEAHRSAMQDARGRVESAADRFEAQALERVEDVDRRSHDARARVETATSNLEVHVLDRVENADQRSQAAMARLDADTAELADRAAAQIGDAVQRVEAHRASVELDAERVHSIAEDSDAHGVALAALCVRAESVVSDLEGRGAEVLADAGRRTDDALAQLDVLGAQLRDHAREEFVAHTQRVIEQASVREEEIVQVQSEATEQIVAARQVAIEHVQQTGEEAARHAAEVFGSADEAARLMHDAAQSRTEAALATVEEQSAASLQRITERVEEFVAHAQDAHRRAAEADDVMDLIRAQAAIAQEIIEQIADDADEARRLVDCMYPQGNDETSSSSTDFIGGETETGSAAPDEQPVAADGAPPAEYVAEVDVEDSPEPDQPELEPPDVLRWAPDPLRNEPDFFSRLAAELAQDPNQDDFPLGGDDGWTPPSEHQPVGAQEVGHEGFEYQEVEYRSGESLYPIGASNGSGPEPVLGSGTEPAFRSGTEPAHAVAVLETQAATVAGSDQEPGPVSVIASLAALAECIDHFESDAQDRCVRIEVSPTAAPESNDSQLHLTTYDQSGWWLSAEITATTDTGGAVSTLVGLGELREAVTTLDRFVGSPEVGMVVGDEVTIGNHLLLARDTDEVPVLPKSRRRVESVDLQAANRSGLLLETQLGRLFVTPELLTHLRRHQATAAELVAVDGMPCLLIPLTGRSTAVNAMIVARLHELGENDAPEVAERRSTPGNEVTQLVNALSANTTAQELERILKVGVGYVRRRAAAHPLLPEEVIHNLIREGTEAMRAAAASNVSINEEAGELVMADPSPVVRAALASNPALADSTLERLADDPDPQVRAHVAANVNVAVDLLDRLAEDPDSFVRAAVAGHQRVSLETLRTLADDPDLTVCAAVASNTACPPDVLSELVSIVPDAVLANPGAAPALLAAGSVVDSPGLRATVAGNPATPPKRLRKLAGDSDRSVLRAVADHPETPARARRRALRQLDGSDAT